MILLVISPILLSAQFIKLFDFSQLSGREPYGSLILDEQNDILYGLTYQGGINDDGTLFKYDLNGSGFAVLMDFENTTGRNPRGSLLKAGSTLFGMTSAGGANDWGTIFKIRTDGTGFTSIFDFNKPTTGGAPFGSLILSGNTLYGMAFDGGPNNLGVVFSIDTSGNNYTIMHGFGGSDGRGPYGDLTLDGNMLYGMTKYGGTSNVGVIFKIQTNGTGFTKMFDFDWLTSGGYPNGSLTFYDNTLYGMASQGGDYGVGVIFKINTSGIPIFNKLMDFQTSTTGEYPWGNLVVYDEHLYGMTDGNGILHYGSIFSVALDGSAFTPVYEFTDPANGSHPKGTPVLDPFTGGIVYYGMTQYGGTSNYGVIFYFNDQGAGIEPVTGHQALILYPVPARDFVMIRSQKTIRTVTIFDLLGKQVYGGTFDSQEIRIPVEGIENGIYFIRVEGDQFCSTRKFLKK
jgi:uncharacterized repeat protein (TIGR03803 family)